MKRFIRSAFTLVELLVVIAVIGLLLGMFLPFVGRGVREPSRRTGCSNNMRQLVLATLNYESAHGHLPTAMGPLDEKYVTAGSSSQLSGFISLLAFMEHNDLLDQIIKSQTYGGVNFPPGPNPWTTGYEPYQQSINVLLCPSSNGNESEFGKTNYGFSIGDVARSIHKPQTARGAFACGLTTCLLYTSPSPRDRTRSRMPSSA